MVSVADLTRAERDEAEETELIEVSEEDADARGEGNPASADDMFCTAAGAAAYRPGGGSSKLREMLNKADRA
ncbi:MAG: hypothetical protein II488_06645 [Firmicutes bacterium]|nr:hypothetical protein [Bacillota bacterium]MBQ4371970.1 hypothetical protein [Bacillota bacterium]MBQ4372368.1 hypothetical protein [Bacillota bacterium]